MGKISEALYGDIKSIYAKYRPLTNCYSMNVVEKATEFWKAGDALIFCFEDHGINRLVYFAEDETKLAELLKLPRGSTFFLEFMARNDHEYEDLLVGAGFTLHARMMRLVNPDCREIREETLRLGREGQGTLAKTADAHEVNLLLWSVFHTEISHLLTDEELAIEIEKGHTSIHRAEDGQVDAVLQCDVMPKKFYINQIVNRGDRRNIHYLLQRELANYVSKGGKYLYAWVEMGNTGSQKFHEKYGMKHDGMWSMIYKIKR